MSNITSFRIWLHPRIILFLAPLLLAACTATVTHPAVNAPDAFAWQLFMEVNQPIPDDPQGRVMWEGWALAREVFADPNATPDWDALTAAPRTEEQFDPMPLQQAFANPNLDALPEFDPLLSPFQVNETRMNRATFDFIVGNELWYVEGQEAMFERNESIVFPTDSKEVKALWRLITDTAQIPLFHTATLTNADGELQTWGLTSLHITTKDLPNWFWATWEHKSNPNREAVVPSRDRAGLPPQLQGTKWENYVLRGSQIDFVDPTGRPTILASSQIEEGFEATSSCITCHARSTIGAAIPGQDFPYNRVPIFLGADPTGQFPIGAVGAPDPAWFFDTSSGVEVPEYVQLDFVWALIRAQRRNP